MKKQFLLRFLGSTFICVLGALGTQNAQAQARFDGGNVLSTASGTGSNMQFILQSGPYLHLFGSDNGDPNISGSINAIAGYNSNQAAVMHTLQNRTSNGGYTRVLQILQSGQVQIGTRTPSGQTDYRLAVDGKIVSTSMYVTNPNTWADFVFAPSFKLMPLVELESYLKANHHLPALPTAVEVEAKGYSVAEMDAKLLQSIEELTLHMIALSKQNAQLQAQMVALRQRVNRQGL